MASHGKRINSCNLLIWRRAAGWRISSSYCPRHFRAPKTSSSKRDELTATLRFSSQLHCSKASGASRVCVRPQRDRQYFEARNYINTAELRIAPLGAGMDYLVAQTNYPGAEFEYLSSANQQRVPRKGPNQRWHGSLYLAGAPTR